MNTKQKLIKLQKLLRSLDKKITQQLDEMDRIEIHGEKLLYDTSMFFSEGVIKALSSASSKQLVGNEITFKYGTEKDAREVFLNVFRFHTPSETFDDSPI